MVWGGRDLQTPLIALPCHGRDSFHQPREGTWGPSIPFFSSHSSGRRAHRKVPRISCVPQGINPRLFPTGPPSTAPFSSPFGLPPGLQPESIPSWGQVIPGPAFPGVTPSPGSSPLTWGEKSDSSSQPPIVGLNRASPSQPCSKLLSQLIPTLWTPSSCGLASTVVYSLV